MVNPSDVDNKEVEELKETLPEEMFNELMGTQEGK